LLCGKSGSHRGSSIPETRPRVKPLKTRGKRLMSDNNIRVR
jgi:hypothetical protein